MKKVAKYYRNLELVRGKYAVKSARNKFQVPKIYNQFFRQLANFTLPFTY